jgi:hypothetical protein
VNDYKRVLEEKVARGLKPENGERHREIEVWHQKGDGSHLFDFIGKVMNVFPLLSSLS